MLTSTADGELDFTTQFLEQVSQLYSNANHSDIAFVVDGVKLPAHKNILTIRSPYFRALLDGGFSESSKSEIELKVPLKAFKLVLRYIYTGKVSLQTIDHKTVLDLLSLVDEYSINEVKTGIASHLLGALSTDNCCELLESALLYGLKDLEAASYSFFDENAYEIIKTDEFKALTVGLLHSLLERSAFLVPEIEIFNAFLEWRDHNQNVGDDEMQKIISAIRFELIDFEDLFSIVRNASVLTEAQLLDVLKTKTVEHNLNHRTLRKPVSNVASKEQFAKVIIEGPHYGSDVDALLNGDFINYTNDSGFTFHSLILNGSIIIQLAQPYYIGSMRLLLWDKDDRTYSFYIETSTDKRRWRTVVDKRNERLRSWQDFCFTARPIVFIKITGTFDSSHCKSLRLVHFEAPNMNTQN